MALLIRRVFVVLVVAMVVAGPALAAEATSEGRSEFTANGSTKVYSFTFPALDRTHVQVQVGGVVQVSSYTVVLNVNQATTPGGIVTFAIAPPARTAVLIRLVPLPQRPKHTPNSVSPATSVESSQEPVTMVAEQVDRNRQDLAKGTGTDDQNASLAQITASGSNTPRSLADRAADVVNVRDFGAKGDGNTDDTAAIQTALDVAVATNGKVVVPVGVYPVSATLTLTGVRTTGHGATVAIEGSGSSSGSSGTVIKWSGPNAIGTKLLSVDGIHRFALRGVLLQGSGTVETLLYATQHAPTTHSGYGWRFDDVVFENVRVNGVGFSIPDTTTDMSRFGFTNCVFAPVAPGSKGFYSSNQNSLNHTFTGCGIQQADYGLYIQGGSFTARSCEFTGNAVADIYLQSADVSTVLGGWSEQSRQFLIGSNLGLVAYTIANVIGVHIASYPWAYWKLKEAGRTQPPNDSTQWAAIVWDRGSPLNLVGSILLDPFVGRSTGSVAPRVSQSPIVLVPNSKKTPLDINVIGSRSSAVAKYESGAKSFVQLGTDQVADRPGSPRHVRVAGSVGASMAISPLYGSTWTGTLTTNTTITMDTIYAEPGMEMVLILTQGGATANYTTTFVGAMLAGGIYSPAAGRGAKSVLRLQYDGVTWVEVGRALNLH